MSRGFEIISVGRDPSNDVQISAPTISRFHLEVIRIKRDGRLYVVDRASEWGTFVARPDGKNAEVRQSFVDASETLIVGEHAVKLADIVAQQAMRE
jgi:pSer/pThr/pTyr-binding forkhead associated (FHA) protein